MGSMLKRLREIWGYSEIELADKLEMSIEELALIENTTEDVDIVILTKYSKILDIRITRIAKLSENYKIYPEGIEERNRCIKEFIKTLNDYVRI